MKLYNLISCKGFVESSEGIKISFGACAKARLVIVAIFFINAIVRKWFGEEIGVEYNFWLGMAGGIMGYLIPLILTGNVLFSFIIGMVVMLAGGYGAGFIIGGEGEYE